MAAPPVFAQGAGNGGCPPGLAKKSPPCVPPGQATKAYSAGDRYLGDGRVVRRGDYGLPPLRDGEAWVRVGDSILRLDREERIILDVVQLFLE
ncbi:excinuclease ABC subunit A [Jannaschia formosa]|nr:excinuclease ABC subunit A [Jannaschia formosa]